ncbi:MAG: hypothetical protein KGN79_10080 [Acidobacteriota bacterium]|nr:hypothetical protein [Acidobacteriota bacterium]
MFERYTQSARRAVFRARNEALAADEQEISVLDLLRGVVCESKHEAHGIEIEWIRENLDLLSNALWPAERSNPEKQHFKTNIKLARDTKMALAYAARVSESNPRGVIDVSTLLLGILSFENLASDLLAGNGLIFDRAKYEAKLLHEKYPPQLPTLLTLAKAELRAMRPWLIRILLFLVFLLGGVAIINLINR